MNCQLARTICTTVNSYMCAIATDVYMVYVSVYLRVGHDREPCKKWWRQTWWAPKTAYEIGMWATPGK